MRYVFVLLAVLLVSQLSQAASLDSEIASVSGRLFRASPDVNYSIRILKNGEVWGSPEGGEENSQLLSTLPPNLVEKIKNYESKIVGPMALKSADVPSKSCADQRIMSYWMRTGDVDESFILAGSYNLCQLAVPTIDSAGTKFLRTVLDGLVENYQNFHARGIF